MPWYAHIETTLRPLASTTEEEREATPVLKGNTRQTERVSSNRICIYGQKIKYGVHDSHIKGPWHMTARRDLDTHFIISWLPRSSLYQHVTIIALIGSQRNRSTSMSINQTGRKRSHSNPEAGQHNTNIEITVAKQRMNLWGKQIEGAWNRQERVPW